MAPDPVPESALARARAELEAAGATLGRYAGTSGEPVFSHLPHLVAALAQVSATGGADDVRAALPVADALGAAWERLGEHRDGFGRLDDLLVAAERQGLDGSVDLARVRRRRARLAMRMGRSAAAWADLEAAHALAAGNDDRLVLAVLLDRVDLATEHGDWDAALALVPELLARTDASGDPRLRAMGLNRTAWSVLGAGDVARARDGYERAWALAALHEDGVVESRSAAGRALVAAEEGDLEVARSAWRHALGLAERLHDRAFALHCLDGVGVLLAAQGRAEESAALVAAGTAARDQLGLPREALLAELTSRVALPEGAVSDRPLGYAEAQAAARAALARS